MQRVISQLPCKLFQVIVRFVIVLNSLTEKDIERPPQLLENGKLGLYMNFTVLHIKRYARVQSLLASCLAKRGLSGYFRPDGELINLVVWWNGSEVDRANDIVYF